MLASKKNAKKASEYLEGLSADSISKAEGKEFIREFLEAARRKLPSEKSYKKDKKRKKVKV
jgi:hypothetical protein